MTADPYHTNIQGQDPYRTQVPAYQQDQYHTHTHMASNPNLHPQQGIYDMNGQLQPQSAHAFPAIAFNPLDPLGSYTSPMGPYDTKGPSMGPYDTSNMGPSNMGSMGQMMPQAMGTMVRHTCVNIINLLYLYLYLYPY